VRRTDLFIEVHKILGKEWNDVLSKQVGKEEAQRLREKFIELTEKAEHEAPKVKAQST
jgi:hypothetical protein